MAFALGKMGVPRLDVWDDDDVAEHNVPMSLYRPKDFMSPKLKALKRLVNDFSGLSIIIHPEKRAEQEPFSGAVVMCVDGMDARRVIWKQVRMNPDVDLLIDTRTAGKLLWVFAVDPRDRDDVAYYDRHVSYGTRQAEPHMCGQHGHIAMSMKAAAQVAENLTSWWMSGIKELHYKEVIASPTAIEEDA